MRADHDPPPRRLQPQHVERLRRGDADALALTDGEMGDAAMPAEHSAGFVDDIAGLAGLRAQAGDDVGVGALRHKADILAVRLVGDRQVELAGQRAGLVLGQAAERKAQEIELVAGGAVEEIALVAGCRPRRGSSIGPCAPGSRRA